MSNYWRSTHFEPVAPARESQLEPLAPPAYVVLGLIGFWLVFAIGIFG